MPNAVLPPEPRFSKFGTAPESPKDSRDHLVKAYAARILTPAEMPDEIGLDNITAHKKYVGITNQMQEGSCTGHGFRNVKTTMEVRQRKTASAKRAVPHHGPRGIYTLGKQVGGYPEEEGAYLRDILKAMATYGVPREKDWPYVASVDDNGKAQDIGTPAKRWMTNAKRWPIGNYARIRTLNELLTVLHTMGPVYMAMDLHENFFETDPEGVIPEPKGEIVGGHSMAFIGAVQSTRRLYTPNNWGPGWGKDGYCWISFDHFFNVRGEAWAVPDYVTS